MMSAWKFKRKLQIKKISNKTFQKKNQFKKKDTPYTQKGLKSLPLKIKQILYIS